MLRALRSCASICGGARIWRGIGYKGFGQLEGCLGVAGGLQGCVLVGVCGGGKVSHDRSCTKNFDVTNVAKHDVDGTSFHRPYTHCHRKMGKTERTSIKHGLHAHSLHNTSSLVGLLPLDLSLLHRLASLRRHAGAGRPVELSTPHLVRLLVSGHKLMKFHTLM